MKKRILTSVTIGFLSLLAACGGNNDNEGNNLEGNSADNVDSVQPLEVITTLFPYEDFTSRIGGEHVNVSNIVPAGSDAHSYEPSANTLIEVAEADLFIFNGADFEGFADSIRDSVANQSVEILEITETMELIGYDHDHAQNDENDHDHAHNDENNHDHGHNDENDDHGNNEENDHDHAHGDEDPHIWLDPTLAAEAAHIILEKLSDLRPEQVEEFENNYETLVTELNELDDQFFLVMENSSKDTIIVSHAGYGYWENRYGIRQVAIAGLSPTNEPSIQQMQSVIAIMEDREIEYVMFEQNIPSNLSETVREQVGAEAIYLHNLESLTEENVENEEDYFSLMQKNIEALQTALQ